MDRTTLALNRLVEMGLLTVNRQISRLTYRQFYCYYTEAIPEATISNGESITLEYEIPPCTHNLLNGRATDSESSIVSSTTPPEFAAEDTSITSTPVDNFQKTFMGWYDELLFNGRSSYTGHFSEKDGRFYHQLHSSTREERSTIISWEGEHITEVWDAHSGFFIVLGYNLTHVRVYENSEMEAAFKDEASRLIRLAANDQLYEAIMSYHNRRSRLKLNRGDIKKHVQRYKNFKRSSLLRKDGTVKKYWWCERYRYIDQYFKTYFPNIRDLFLDYPRRTEIDNDQRYRVVHNVDGHYYYVPQTKSVSNLQRDIMPNEFQLISLGLCKDIWHQHGIKSVTVHDAIYMKKSDAQKGIDINAILAKRLGVSLEPLKSIALF